VKNVKYPWGLLERGLLVQAKETCQAMPNMAGGDYIEILLSTDMVLRRSLRGLACVS
jgi:hypothetical protein